MPKNTNRSRASGRAWKNERASVKSPGKSRPKSNKSSPTSDTTKHSGSASQYWRAGYTRKDGTKVKGHYVKKSTS